MASETDKRAHMERRVIQLTDCEVRAADGDGPATFSGYAAVFNELSVNLGGFRERIRPGAFRTAIDSGDDVRFLINHDANMVLGRTPKTVTLAEDERGLRVDCELPNTTYANDLVESMRRDDVNQMSFGFTTRADAWPEKDAESGLPIRELVDVGLFDVSVVTYPAYPDTQAAVREMRAEIAADHPELLERAERAAEELLAEEIVDATDEYEMRETWTDAEINDLPDSAFLYIEDGGEKDDDGKTTPRDLRHFPYKDAEGKVDLPHLRDALGRIPQSDLPDDVKTEVEAKAKKILEDNGGEKNDAGEPDETADTKNDELADKTREAFEAFEALRAEAGVSIDENHAECEGVAVVWNWNGEMHSCHTDRAAAEAEVEALMSGAAGAAREAELKAALEALTESGEKGAEAVKELVEAARAGKVLSKDNQDKLSQAHELLHSVLSAAGEPDAGFDDMGGSASTEPDENVKGAYASIREFVTESDLSTEDLRAAIEERGWGWDDDANIWSLTDMISSASCFLLFNGGEGDYDGGDDQAPDDAQGAVMREILKSLTGLLDQIVAEASAERGTAHQTARRRLALLELEASL